MSLLVMMLPSTIAFTPLSAGAALDDCGPTKVAIVNAIAPSTMARIGVLVENINNPSERSSVLSAIQAIFCAIRLQQACGIAQSLRRNNDSVLGAFVVATGV